MKTSCPACGSSDARHIYDDHEYCFSCGDWSPGEGSVSTSSKAADPFEDFVHGKYQDLPNRSLREASLRKFKYSFDKVHNQDAHIANYYDVDTGRLCAQKIRWEGKRFSVLGDLSRAGLFGEQLWQSGGKRLVITEGELDAISYAQATGLSWPVVSIPNGAQGAVKAVKKRLDWIETFEDVIFMFDNDVPGQDAARECAALLRPGLARVASLPLKDASEMLVAGRGRELADAHFQAKTVRPDGIVEGTEIQLADLMKALSPGYMTPFTGLNAVLRGLHPGKLLMLCAGSGIGKSTLARELWYHLTKNHGVRVGGIMLEESLQISAQGLIAIDNNVPLGDLMLKPELLTEDQWATSKSAVVDTSVFYDSWGSSEVDRIIAKCRYLAVGCGCQFIVLDHISMVVSGLETTDERKTIDILMTKLRQVCEQTGVGVIAVVHLKRNSGKASFNEGGQVSITDLRGSASIEQISDFVVAAERDQQDEELGNVVSYRVLKNRTFGKVGPAGRAVYNEATGRLENYEDFDLPAPNNESSVPSEADANFTF